MNNNFAIEFNTCVENVKRICREARHMGVSDKVNDEMPKFCKFLDDVNFKMEFVSNPEDYVRGKMLDALDYLKDNLVDYYASYPYPEDCVNSHKVVNSIYDCVRDFYFEAPYTYGFLG